MSATLEQNTFDEVLDVIPGATVTELISVAVALLMRKYSGQNEFQTGLLHGAPDALRLSRVATRTNPEQTLDSHARRIGAEIRRAFSDRSGSLPGPGSQDERLGVVIADGPALCAPALRAVVPGESPPFDLAVSAEVTTSGLVLHVDHHQEVFDQEVASRAVGHLVRIIELLGRAPETTIAELDVLTAAERQQVVTQFNATRRPYERDASIPALFAEQVRLHPDRPAVVHGGATLTYSELDRRVGLLAAVLSQEGIGSGDRVALMFGKVPEMVVATVAILRIGATYVPVDPDYPPERRDFLLRDSTCRALVTTSGYDLPESLGVQVIDVAAAPRESAPRTDPVDGVISALAGAYVMYTSGTTGQPKGVLINHRAIVRLVRNTDFVGLSADTRILQTGAIVFDATTFELWGALLNGGTLVLTPDHTILDAATLREEITRHAVTTMWLTAPLFHQLVEQDPSVFAAPLRDLLVGGDVLSVRRVNKALEVCPGLRIINGYGPTENTTFSTTHVIDRQYEDSIPIGRPIANSTAYVLDCDGRPQPVGVSGELYVGGDGVSDGYLNRPELNEKAFVADPFVTGGRLYRTGDMVAWQSDGTIEFRGRVDNQVKIRGFRVEPGEVEKHLLALPEIREAVVLVRQRAGGVEKYLAAYFTAQRPLTQRDLRAALRRNLPAYLVPSSFVQVEVLPLNRNGKVDRAALIRNDNPAVRPANDTVTSGDEIARALVEIWRGMLDVPDLKATDNLFELGITSLTAALMAAGIQERFDVRIPAARILAHPTAEAVANLIRGGGVGRRLPTITRGPTRALYPVTSQQRRLYVEQQKDPEATQYNVPVIVDVPDRVDPTKLEAALRALIHRHESLRTNYVSIGNEILQRVRDEVRFDLDPAHSSEDLVAFVRPFDLARGPLVRAAVLTTENSSRIVLDFHHISVDGIALGVLLDELQLLYQGRSLPPVALQYRDYALWQAGVGGEQIIAQQEPFWVKTFAEPPASADLPTDFDRAQVRASQGSRLGFEFGVPRSDLIRELGRREGATLFQTMLAVYFVFLSQATGRSDLTVGTPVAGRPGPELDGVVGMFANTLCLRVDADPRLTFTEFLRRTTSHLTEALSNQDYPFDTLVERVAADRDYSRNPLFDTMFAVTEAESTGTFLGAAVTPADSLNTHSMFDLNLQISQVCRNLTASWAFSTGLFREQTIVSLRDSLLGLVDSVVARPEQSLGELISGMAMRQADPVDIAFNF